MNTNKIPRKIPFFPNLQLINLHGFPKRQLIEIDPLKSCRGSPPLPPLILLKNLIEAMGKVLNDV